MIVSPEARQDLREIEEYIAQDNPAAALAFVERLTERFTELVDFPNIGRKRDDIRSGYRSIAEGNYVIYYRVLPEVVEIMHVLHGARHAKEVFKQE